MIFLAIVLAIIVGMIIFSIIRSLFIPFLIVMGIGLIISKVENIFPTNHPDEAVASSPNMVPAENIETKNPVRKNIEITQEQKAVCNFFAAANQSFLPLEAQWNEADTEKNKIASKLKKEPINKKINEIYKTRNENIYNAIGKNNPRIINWRMTVRSYIYTDDPDGGTFSADLISQCDPQIIVKIFMFTPRKKDLPILSKISEGSVIDVSGSIIPKYKDDGITPDNIEWGGTRLWSDYGDLVGHEVFQDPTLEINPTKFSIPFPQ